MRTTIGTILVVLACLLAAPAVAAYALVGEVTDQQAYLDAVTPLADDPDIQQAVASQIKDAIVPKVPEAAAPLVQQNVDKFVASPDFRELWVNVNKEAHPQVLAMLRGEQGGTLSVQGDAIVLNLGDVAAQLRERMVAEGVPLADQIPAVDASVQLLSQPAVKDLVPAFDLLEKLSVILPVLTLILLVGGIVLSAKQGRTMVVAGIGLVVTMLLLVLFVFLARSQVAAQSSQPELAGTFYDALTNDVMVIAWIVCGVGGVLVLAGAFIASAQSRRAAAVARPRRASFGESRTYGR